MPTNNIKYKVEVLLKNKQNALSFDRRLEDVNYSKIVLKSYRKKVKLTMKFTCE